MQKGGDPAAAPTGCFKCGRPGHWSRDCPFSPATNTNPSASANPNPEPPAFPSYKFPQQAPSGKEAGAAPAKATKKAPKTRPKLTPDLLLSDDGLGYVLRHFPRNFKYRGKEHEVADLGNLIGMYAEWHSRLIPYYPFDQFVHKVEQVGATKRVRRCISELRERVARGGDPTKLHEPPVELAAPDCEQGMDMGVPVDMEEPVTDKVDQPLEAHDDIQEEMFDEIYRKVTEESGPSQQEQHQASEVIAPSVVNTEQRTPEETPKQQTANNTIATRKVSLTAEQKARMEANRLKALQRAAARAGSSQSPPSHPL